MTGATGCKVSQYLGQDPILSVFFTEGPRCRHTWSRAGQWCPMRPISLAEMTGDHMAGVDFAQCGNVDPASCLGVRAAGVKGAAGRRIDRAGDIALQQLFL